MKLASLLLSSLFLLSCARVKPYIDSSISTDRDVIEVLLNKSESIETVSASLGIKPVSIVAPEIDAYLSYNREGAFRLTGLSPTGFTLFDFQIYNNQSTLSLSTDIFTFLPEQTGPADIAIIREAIDFYGSDSQLDTSFLIEDFRRYYVVNQLRRDANISYPIRRWWIDKGDMVVVRKEIFSSLPDKKGERLFEALYGDFRIVDNIMTPFEIVLNDGKGKKVVEIRFNKIEYNKDNKE